MTDKFDIEKRREIMSMVHSKNTTPEIRVRKILHRMGYRFRLHRDDLPGKPDIVLPKYKSVILINGCFWHGCPNCQHGKVRPKNNEDYWNRKLDRNILRDKENISVLEQKGWKVLVIWECETKKSNINNLEIKLRQFLTE